MPEPPPTADPTPAAQETSDTKNSLRHFCFVLIPGYSLLAIAGAIDVLRAANLGVEDADQLYSWQLIGTEKTRAQARSSSGLGLLVNDIESVAVEQLPERTVIAVCGGDNSHNFSNQHLTHWLKRAATRDIHIGSISDGAFVVAACGLFFGHRSTIHWKCLDAYKSKYPDLDIRATILEIDRRRFSCAGGTSSLDLFLHFVRQDFGADRAARISSNYLHDVVRDNTRGQNTVEAYRYAGHSKALSEALRIMAVCIEEPVSIKAIAAQSGATHRSLDRLFKRHLGMGPARYYRELRLRRAASLLQQTGMPISEIALACGFSTSSHLGQHFRKIHGQTPGVFRRLSTSPNTNPDKTPNAASLLQPD